MAVAVECRCHRDIQFVGYSAFIYLSLVSSSLLPSSQIILHTVVAVNAEDGDAAILACLGKTEEHRPQHTLSDGADRQQHLGERQDVKRYAA